MVVKKTNGDGKAKNGAGKSTARAKPSESNLVDKNGNMLPAESKGKRDEKCQMKRQGIKTINTTDGKGLSSQEIITTYEADDGTVYELDGKGLSLYKRWRTQRFNIFGFEGFLVVDRKLFVLLL
jgi:hypothetical protein